MCGLDRAPRPYPSPYRRAAPVPRRHRRVELSKEKRAAQPIPLHTSNSAAPDNRHDPRPSQDFHRSAYEHAVEITPETKGVVRDAVEEVLDLLDRGELRWPRSSDGGWVVHQWLKKAILLSFRLTRDRIDRGRARRRGVVGQGADQIRQVEGQATSRRPASAPCPGAVVRRSAYIAPGVVLMPSFVNLGARVESGTMIDTWATVGSCAQIGKNVHLSGGAGIGGVLEPLQAEPGDHRGQLLHRRPRRGGRGRDRRRRLGAVDGRLSRPSTKIVDRATGEVHQGRVPPYSVVVSGAMPGKPLPGRSAGPVALLRRDRQDASTRRPAPRPRSTSCSGIDRKARNNELDLAAVLLQGGACSGFIGGSFGLEREPWNSVAVSRHVATVAVLAWLARDWFLPGTEGQNRYGPDPPGP